MPSPSAERKKSTLPEIPEKLYFRIGEVARLCAVPAYVLRFWETEFPQLRPNKSGTGQRLYRRREVELARRIRALLYDEGYTIPGARQAFNLETRKGSRSAGATVDTLQPAAAPLPDLSQPDLSHPDLAQSELRLGVGTNGEVPWERLRTELKEILGILSSPPRDTGARPKAASSTTDETTTTSDLFD